MTVRLLVVTLLLAALGSQMLRPVDLCADAPPLPNPSTSASLSAAPSHAYTACAKATECVAFIRSPGTARAEFLPVVSTTGVLPSTPRSRVDPDAHSSLLDRIGLRLARLSVLRT